MLTERDIDLNRLKFAVGLLNKYSGYDGEEAMEDLLFLIENTRKLQAQNKVMREGLEKIFRPECCWCGVDQEHDENCAFVLARQTLQRVKEVEDAPGS